MSRIVKFAAVLAALAFCVWSYFSPHLTVRAMREAAQRNDAQGFASHIDFPALRASVKEQLSARIAAQFAPSKDSSALEALGAKLAGALGNTGLGNAVMDRAIDTMVSPEALSAAFAGRDVITDPSLRSLLPSFETSTQTEKPSIENLKIAMRYRNFNTFAVDIADATDPQQHVEFIMLRDKLLWWKLSAIELPKMR